MVSRGILCAFVGLFSTVASDDDEVLVPALKSDFKKGNSPAQWAKNYPKAWGSEDFRIGAYTTVTEDEKYAVGYNQTHASFFGLEVSSNTPISIVDLETPQGYYINDLRIRLTLQGGYDLLMNVEEEKSPYTLAITKRRVSSNLTPIGNMTLFRGGMMGDIDKNGRVVASSGYILDLNNPDSNITLKDPGLNIRYSSFSSDGQYLSTTGPGSADLYNATSGEKMFSYPQQQGMANWLDTKISPDGNSIAMVSDGPSGIQVFSLADLSAEPKSIKKIDVFKSIAWSPNGQYLAVGDNGLLQVWRFPEVELVQTWEVDLRGIDYPYYAGADIFFWSDNG